MSTKYILDPSGDIIKITDGNVESPEDVKSSDFLSVVNEGQNVNVNDSAIQLNGIGILSTDNSSDYIISDNNNDSSFGFVNNQTGSKKSYKPFNSFTKKEDDEDSMPKAFADEFEILTGMRLRGDEVLESIPSLTASLLVYLIESTVRIVAVEAIVAANKSLFNSKGEQSRTAERYKLTLGNYDFTEFDVFTKYIFNVLNYPHEQSTTIERINGYYLGFSAWLSPDSAIDLDNIIKNKSKALNSIDFLSIDKKDNNLAKDLLLPLTIAASEIAIASITNTTSVNRLKLLLRKFHQERYWDSNLLYSAKDRNPVLSFFADLNYYYFRFFIERMQVGLKLLNKYYYDDSYLQINTIESPLNRVSASRSLDCINLNIQSKKTKNVFGVDVEEQGSYNWKYSEKGGNSNRKAKQTTSIRSLPQAFNLHHSFYRALALNGKKFLELPDDLMQNFNITKERRISPDLVREIENHLESEYMPFYFHDLRTNEILSFHAFIENISDSFSPEYNSSSGFGRIDDVKTYVKTTRNINLTFIIAATSEADHDLMWFQVNKIVAMVYPQWSDAFDVVKRDQNGNPQESLFKYPFTQVPTASPLIRLRVGDVIKSNYSRTNLSRLHGIGDRDFDKSLLKANPEEESLERNISATKAKLAEIDNKYKGAIIAANKNVEFSRKKELESKESLDYFVNNKDKILKRLEKKYAAQRNTPDLLGDSAKYNALERYKVLKEEKQKIKTASRAYLINDLQVKEDILKKYRSERFSVSLNDKNTTSDIRFYYLQPGLYRTTSSSVLDIFNLNKSDSNRKSIKIDHEVLILNEKVDLSKDFVVVNIEKDIQVVADVSKIRVMNPDLLVDDEYQSDVLLESTEKIMNPVSIDAKGNKLSNNPITRAYESGMSRGLAGFITNLDVSYNESTWETGRIGSKAPMMVKINIGFSPIHDIPPGLDHNGMLRAPTYNVGRINNEFFGDPHDGAGKYKSFFASGANEKISGEYSHGAGRDAAMQKYDEIEKLTKVSRKK